VDKPEGPTSHDVVSVARRALGVRRVGHTGTLDPFASGLLLLCVGRATRLAQFLTDLDKTYEATARLGATTDTDDRQGAVRAATDSWRDVTGSALEDAVDGLRGEGLQTPPQFSAKKVRGEAAHRRARRGEVTVLQPRPVTVHELEVLEYVGPDVRFRVRCSSGTYVRSLARDLGESLGVGAHLVGLRRTRIGTLDVRRALGLDELKDRAAEAWIEPLDALSHLPRLDLDPAATREIAHGRPLPVEEGALDFAEEATVVAAHGGMLVAVGQVTGGSFRPRKVFVDG
jgi:tRNA pseudouridine55 synthase